MKASSRTMRLNREAEDKRTPARLSPLLSSCLDAFQCLILALVFSLSWTWILQRNLGVATDFTLQLPWQLAIMLLVMLIYSFRSFSLPLLALALLAGLAAIFLPALQPLKQLLLPFFLQVRQSFLWCFAATRGDLLQPSLFTHLVGALAALLAISFIWAKPLPFLLLCILLVPFLAAAPQTAAAPENITAMLICLPVLVICFSRYGKLRFGRQVRYLFPPLLLAALILAASFLLNAVIPQNALRSPELAEDMRQLQKRFGAPETINYFEFSLRDAGYYPLNQTLGGPLQLRHEAYMNVFGPEQALYLRGAVSEEYSGHAWIGELMEPNYVFENGFRRGHQQETFQYPEEEGSSADLARRLFLEADLSIQPLQRPVQVIFNGGRPLRIDSSEREEQSYYFNPGGQLYAGRELSAEGYRLHDWLPLALTPAELQASLIENVAAGFIAPESSESQGSYRAILQTADPALYSLVYENPARDAASRLKKLFDIRNYLSSNYIYRLDVAYPDENEDFLNGFFREKEGYCTYFATAMTELAREAGIRARYVEGFLVPGVDPEISRQENYGREVSSDSAHAWTEVYFQGLGWYPIDATPGDSLDQMQQDEDESQRREPERQTTTTPPPTSPPTTTASSIQPPSSSPSERPSQPEQSLPRPPQAQRPPLSQGLRRLLMTLALLLLVLLLLVFYLLYCARRYRRRHDPLWYGQQKRYTEKEWIAHVWSDMKHMAELAGLSFAPSHTLQQCCRELERLFVPQRRDGALRAYLAMERALYGDLILAEGEKAAVLAYYEEVENGLRSKLPKWKWLLRRWLFPGPSGRFQSGKI